jgi:hypothetical protein
MDIDDLLKNYVDENIKPTDSENKRIQKIYSSED